MWSLRNGRESQERKVSLWEEYHGGKKSHSLKRGRNNGKVSILQKTFAPPELQELRELRHDWAKEQMSRVFLAKLTLSPEALAVLQARLELILKCGCYLDDSRVNYSDIPCENPPKSVTLFHGNPQVK